MNRNCLLVIFSQKESDYTHSEQLIDQSPLTFKVKIAEPRKGYSKNKTKVEDQKNIYWSETNILQIRHTLTYN